MSALVLQTRRLAGASTRRALHAHAHHAHPQLQQLLRSVLFVPATSPKALLKAQTAGSDAVVLDLEQAPHPAVKAEAREALLRALASFPASLCVAVRINASGGEQQRLDLAALRPLLEAAAAPSAPAPAAGASPAAPRVDALVLPRVECAQQLQLLRAALGPAASRVAIWAIVETPAGVLAAPAVAAAARATGTTCLLAGTSDLSKELHAQLTSARTPLLLSLSTIVLAARAHGLQCLDGAHLALDDEDGLRLSCQQGRELGFDGKVLVHPSQVEEANANFAPAPAELEAARLVVKAWEAAAAAAATAAATAGSAAAAAAANGGVVVVGGRLVEELHYDEARHLLQLAATIEARAASTAAAR